MRQPPQPASKLNRPSKCISRCLTSSMPLKHGREVPKYPRSRPSQLGQTASAISSTKRHAKRVVSSSRD
eukprot:5705288-Amphidinium_carterae.1